jgi:hypothetical protein
MAVIMAPGFAESIAIYLTYRLLPFLLGLKNRVLKKEVKDYKKNK